MKLERLRQTLEDINEIGAGEKGVTRLAYTDEWLKGIGFFTRLCESENMTVRIDPCGNLIARREGRFPQLPAVALGSHLDTVLEGGRYDGTAGIVAALEVVRSLNERGIETDHPIEIICFACEESSRFGISTLGSKAMAGLLGGLQMDGITDKNGVTFREALHQCSLDFDRIGQAKREPRELKVFFELHVEQGPVLEASQKRIGIVTHIAAPTRLTVHVQGKSSHSGTTPLEHRRDALAGAAEIILEVERAAKAETNRGTVATVGACEIKPGLMNVVPGSAELNIDIRGISMASKEALLRRLFACFEKIQKVRDLSVTYRILGNERPVPMHPEVIRSLSETCENKNIPHLLLTSGAGHDAMNMATLCPTGMLFVPSKSGLSHHPDEYTSAEDIAIGVEVLEEEVLKWACHSNNFQQRGEVNPL